MFVYIVIIFVATVSSKVWFFFVEYICHVYVRSDSLAGIVIGDHEYPNRVAHTLINKVSYLNTVAYTLIIRLIII